MREHRVKIVRISWREHAGTGLLAAYSDDLKGLMVFGRSDEELDRKIPGAIRELFEAQGHQVISIEPKSAEEWAHPSQRTMSVELDMAA